MDAANGTELATLAPPQSTPNNGSTPMTTAANSTQNLLPLASTASNLSTPVPAPTSTLPAANGVSSTTSPPQPASSWRSRGKERFTLLKNSFRSTLASIKERFQLHLASIKEFFQPHLAVLKYAYRPTIALLIYSFTLYTVYTAPSLFSPLGRVDPDYGIWLLAALGKVGDISFAFAVEDAFDTLAWRKLKKRQGVRGKMGLMLWMSLLSSTGFEALVKMVWRGLRRWKWWRRWKGGVRVPVWERWKYGKEVRWSLTRLVFLSILIPGPGIILLANISPTPVCHPTLSMSVTGGLATYDPRIAEVYHTKWGPEIAKLIRSTLRDRSIAWPVDEVGEACGASNSCEAFLLAGPYGTVSPWPFTNKTEDWDEEGFLLEKAPVYMVEMWNLENGDEVAVWGMEDDCVLYGGFDAKNEFSTLVCIVERGVDDELAAAWYVCQLGYAPNGTCLEPAALSGRYGWKMHVKFYRRTADIVFSRADFTILSVENLSTPVSQVITADSLFRALSSIFYRPNQTDNDFRYDRKAQQYVLTQNTGIQLWNSLRENMRGTSFGRDWLRNALTMPLYLFQPTVLAIDTSLPLNEIGTLPQPNIPDENKLKGSYCRVSTRSVPGRGTVIAYTCVAGLVVGFVIGVKGVAWGWGDVETSGFLMADFDVLTRVLTEGGEMTEVRLGDKIGVVGTGISGRQVLAGIEGLGVALR